MPSPKTILPLLLGAAIGAAGILQGLHWKSTAAPAERSHTSKELRAAREEIEMLRRENESLRSMARGTEQAADQLQTTALALAGKMADQPDAAPSRVLVSKTKRHLTVTRPSPLRVRFLNTSEPTTAAALSRN